MFILCLFLFRLVFFLILPHMLSCCPLLSTDAQFILCLSPALILTQSLLTFTSFFPSFLLSHSPFVQPILFEVSSLLASCASPIISLSTITALLLSALLLMSQSTPGEISMLTFQPDKVSSEWHKIIHREI